MKINLRTVWCIFFCCFIAFVIVVEVCHYLVRDKDVFRCRLHPSKDVIMEYIDAQVTQEKPSDVHAKQLYEVTADGKSTELFFSAGLKFNEEYTVNIPDTIKNSAGDSILARSLSFTTESPIFSTGTPEVNVSGNTANISLNVTNNGIIDHKICVLTVVYDQQNKVVRMVNNTFEIPVGMNDVVTSTVDVTGISSPYVKAYVWNGVNIE